MDTRTFRHNSAQGWMLSFQTMPQPFCLTILGHPPWLAWLCRCSLCFLCPILLPPPPSVPIPLQLSDSFWQPEESCYGFSSSTATSHPQGRSERCLKISPSSLWLLLLPLSSLSRLLGHLPLLFLKHRAHASASGPLYLPFPWGCSLTFLKFPMREAFPDFLA